MKLTPSDTNIASIEDRKRERVLQETSQRGFIVVAVDADDAHQIGDVITRTAVSEP
jgi:acetolactate synthase regulatory subunit